MPTQEQPWISGPVEILQHGFDLLEAGSPADLRLALIAVDNAVELAIRTFLELPPRVTGVRVPRKRLQEIQGSFPTLLDTLEEFSSDRLGDIDLGVIEWYHRLRNQLYHQGHGLSVEREKVEIYSQIANALLRNLFGAAPVGPRTTANDILVTFITLWPRLESKLSQAARALTRTGAPVAPARAARMLHGAKLISEEDFEALEHLRELRNQVVHGASGARQLLTESHVASLTELAKKFESSLP